MFLNLALVLTLGITDGNIQPLKTEKEMFGLFKKQDPIGKFWQWFQKNEPRLRYFQQNPDKILTEVLDNAKKIERGLAIEFEPPANNIIKVTVSADGDKNLFSVVKEIVAKAPKIQGWEFIAFRQRMPSDLVKGMVLKAQGHELNPNKMKFFPIVEGDTLDIIVYAENITEENFNQVAYGGLLIIDNILGEYDCVMKVRNYDFHNMPVEKEELKDLKPLLELAEYVDNFHKTKNK
jgi:hypothetical protein